MIKRTLASLFIALAAIFLVACGSFQQEQSGGGLKMSQSLLSVVDPALIETRYCGKAERSAKVVAAFRRIHACPSTGLHTGACPDWQVDHVIPRDLNGCDVVSNMQWLPIWLKTCAGHCKDRFERKIYCQPVEAGGTGCSNSIIQPKE